ncbi:MAG: hypothetical protein QOE89_1530, partial [Pseudonocardiales bacterium]|nr:hypothetical protein [Pseudonocardiales bacterium]
MSARLRPADGSAAAELRCPTTARRSRDRVSRDLRRQSLAPIKPDHDDQ